MKEKEKIKLWLFILVISIIVVGIAIFFTYKKIAYEKTKVETYIIYDNNYAYYYNNKNWSKINDISFLKKYEFDIYNDNQFMGRWSINISVNPVRVSYNTEGNTYYKLIGLNSNKSIIFKEYDYQNITDEDINFAKQYLTTKNQAYIDGETEVKVLKMDIDADALFEKLYIIRYTGTNFSYAHFIIQDGSNIETILSYNDNNGEYTHKSYKLGLIIDADLNEKKEILIIENGYEYSKLLLYANQYGTYSLVE